MAQEMRRAIVRILVSEGADPSFRGSGFAIGRKLVLTSLHVVANKEDSPPSLLGEIQIEFGGLRVPGALVDYDAETDWALIEGEVPEDVHPLVVVPASRADGEAQRNFWTWGFPELNNINGKTFRGLIHDFEGQFGSSRAPVLELYSEELKGVPVHGLSGAPIVEGEHVIGLVRTTLEQNELSFGTIYATPVAEVLKSAKLREAFLNPYRGLRAFSEDESEFFCGRKSETKELLNKLRGSMKRLLTIAGASGSGKSSLLLAGLVPLARLEGLGGKQRLHVLKLRPGARPVHELALQLWGAWGSERGPTVTDIKSRLTAGGDALSDFVDEQLLRRRDDAAVLIVIDQLEELFTQGSTAEEHEQFFDLLISAASVRGGRTWVLTSLRTDFLGPLRASQFEPIIRGGAQLVGAVTDDALHEVIVAPAERVGLRFEDNLVERLVNEARQGASNLAHLQFALDFLWRHRKVNLLTWKAYGDMGGLRGAIARRAGDLVSKLSEEEKRRLPAVFVELVHVGEGGAPNTRSKADVGDMERIDPRFRELLQPFVEERLVILDEHKVEIGHDSLISEWAQLGTWVDEDRGRRLMRQRLNEAAETWDENERADEYLLRGYQLRQVLDVIKDPDKVDDVALALLVASLVVENRDLATWLPRFPTRVLKHVIDHLFSTAQNRAGIRALEAARADLAEPLGAWAHLSSTITLTRDTELAKQAALAVGALSLTDSAVEAAQRATTHAEAIPWEVALAHLRNQPGIGRALFERLSRPLKSRVRRRAAVELLFQNRLYVVTIVASIYLATSLLIQGLPLLDILIGNRGSLPISAFDLTIVCALGAFVGLRQAADGTPARWRQVLFIGAMTLLLSDLLSVLAEILEVTTTFAKRSPLDLRQLLLDLVFPFTMIVVYLPVAAYFRGTERDRASVPRLVSVALAAATIGTIWGAFGQSALRWLVSQTWVAELDTIRLVQRMLYGWVVVLGALLTFRAVETRFRTGTAPTVAPPLRPFVSAGLLLAVLALGIGQGLRWAEKTPWLTSAEEQDRLGEELTWREQDFKRGLQLLWSACQRGRKGACLTGIRQARQAAEHLPDLTENVSASKFLRAACEQGHDFSCAELTSDALKKGDLNILEFLKEFCASPGRQLECRAIVREARLTRDARALPVLEAGCKSRHSNACVARANQATGDAAFEWLIAAYRIDHSPELVDFVRREKAYSAAIPAEILKSICREAPDACAILGSNLRAVASSKEQREEAVRILKNACDAGYVPACLDMNSGQVTSSQNGGPDFEVARLCVAGDRFACEHAAPPTRAEAARQLWRKGDLTPAITLLQDACRGGESSACLELGQHMGQIREARTRHLQVPTALAQRYPTSNGVTVAKLLDRAENSSFFAADDASYSFTTTKYEVRGDVSLTAQTLRFDGGYEHRCAALHVIPEPADWRRVDMAAPATLPASVRSAADALARGAFEDHGSLSHGLLRDFRLPGTFVAATFIIACRRSETNVALISLHLEAELEDKSLVVAWRHLR